MAWNPDKGLYPWGIRALMERMQITRNQVAMEAGVQSNFWAIHPVLDP